MDLPISGTAPTPSSPRSEHPSKPTSPDQLTKSFALPYQHPFEYGKLQNVFPTLSEIHSLIYRFLSVRSRMNLGLTSRGIYAFQINEKLLEPHYNLSLKSNEEVRNLLEKQSAETVFRAHLRLRTDKNVPRSHLNSRGIYGYLRIQRIKDGDLTIDDALQEIESARKAIKDDLATDQSLSVEARGTVSDKNIQEFMVAGFLSKNQAITLSKIARKVLCLASTGLDGRRDSTNGKVQPLIFDGLVPMATVRRINDHEAKLIDLCSTGVIGEDFANGMLSLKELLSLSIELALLQHCAFVRAAFANGDLTLKRFFSLSKYHIALLGDRYLYQCKSLTKQIMEKIDDGNSFLNSEIGKMLVQHKAITAQQAFAPSLEEGTSLYKSTFHTLLTKLEAHPELKIDEELASDQTSESYLKSCGIKNHLTIKEIKEKISTIEQARNKIEFAREEIEKKLDDTTLSLQARKNLSSPDIQECVVHGFLSMNGAIALTETERRRLCLSGEPRPYSPSVFDYAKVQEHMFDGLFSIDTYLRLNDTEEEVLFRCSRGLVGTYFVKGLITLKEILSLNLEMANLQERSWVKEGVVKGELTFERIMTLSEKQAAYLNSDPVFQSIHQKQRTIREVFAEPILRRE